MVELLDGAPGVGGGTVGEVPAGAGEVDMPPLLAPGPPDCACTVPAMAPQARMAMSVFLTIGSSKGHLRVNRRRTRALHPIATS